MSRGRNTGEERKHIDMGKRYGNGIQRSALSPASQLPSVVRPPPLSACPLSPPSGRTREEIALLITRRNVLFRALCNIANRGVLRLLRTDWRRKIVAAFAIRDTLRDSDRSRVRDERISISDSCIMHKYICISHLSNPSTSLSGPNSREMSSEVKIMHGTHL